MTDDLRTQLGSAAILVLLALLAAVRKRLREGKRVFPRVRLRTYLSIRSPSDPAPRDVPEVEPEPASSRERAELLTPTDDDADTLRPKRPRRTPP